MIRLHEMLLFQGMTRHGTIPTTHQVGLGGLLQGEDGRALEAKVGLEVLGDFAYQALERQLADQQLGGLLVAADLAQGHGAGPVPVDFSTDPIRPMDLRTKR